MGANTETMRTETRASPLAQRLLWGAVAGLAGGVVFGVMMGMMGMLSMVAGLVGSSSAVVGAVVHMVISAIIGAGFGLVAGGMSESYGPAAVAGLVYGAAWWVLGPLLIMPSLMGMGPQLGTAFAPPMLMSLLGHLLYGLVTGAAYAFLIGRLRNA
jgi:uncharacterized membrane protein YagU involved in acid resistance